MASLQTQPFIIEQSQKPKPLQEQITKQKSTLLQNNYQPQISETQFFQIMDQIDEYDKMIKEMNDLYTEGMLRIANVKFINPYSSLSTKGFKPTPGLVKVRIGGRNSKENDKEGEMFSLVTQHKNISFTNSVIESINSGNSSNQQRQINPNHVQQQIQQQTQSHSAHSSHSTANQLYSYEEEQMIIEEQQTIEQCRKLTESDKFQKDSFILQRFNIESQKEITIQGMNKFDLLLGKLLQIAWKKLQIERKFNQIQRENKIK